MSRTRHLVDSQARRDILAAIVTTLEALQAEHRAPDEVVFTDGRAEIVVLNGGPPAIHE